ncbi:MAG TPA: tetratricopeptide repeat protein [Bacteroidales bacterium]|jgi:tetratricopeptide (TPR) repeat protein|nr:tetratricopeptide repeat protein [Bacteroidales bacterium]
MKKTILLLALVLVTGITFAQFKKDRTSAYNYWQKGDLTKAKEYIDKAIAYPEASTDAKVHYYCGAIYLDIHFKPDLKTLAPNALQTAYDEMKKAQELDTKGEFKSELMIRMLTLGGQFFNAGADFFKENNFADALTQFKQAAKIGEENHSTDTLGIYGTALCYEKLLDYDNAMATYEKLIQIQMKEPSIYSSLANVYLEKNMVDKADKILQEGLDKFPGNFDMILNTANFYIKTKQHQKALQSLSVAKEKDPQNKSIAFAVGVTYDMLKNDTTLPASDRKIYFDNAVKAYQETIDLDPTYFDALFNIGAVYFNKGGDLINEANRLPLGDNRYEALEAEGKDFLNKALPYLEKAEQVKTGDRDTLLSLKEVYTRLAMYDKLKEINDKLNQ